MMETAFYLILKPLLVFEINTFLSFGYIEKRLDKKA